MVRLVASACFVLCFGRAVFAQGIPAPGEVDLRGAVAERRVSTPLGAMDVRWPRDVERCLGRSPARAVQDAAQAVTRAISQARFESELKTGRRDWAILFMDRRTASASFPGGAALSGHPGFMTPPNNIYIVADNIAGDCSSGMQSSVTDEVLARVLIHEMGHVLEFVLTGPNAQREPYRIEGFARWFEEYAAGGSSLVSPQAVTQETNMLVQSAPGEFVPEYFNYSVADYARASLYFRAVVARRGVGGLMEIYRVIQNEGLPFLAALQKTTGWSDAMLKRELNAVRGG